MKHASARHVLLTIALALTGCTSSHDLPPGDAEPTGEASGCVLFGDTTRFRVTVPAADPSSCLALTVSIVEDGHGGAVPGDVEVTPGYAFESASRLDLPCERVRAGETATGGAAIQRAEGAIVVSQVRGDCWDLDAELSLEIDGGSRESVNVQVRDMTTCLP